MTAVACALASAALFGATIVALRVGLRGIDVRAGSLATMVPACAVTAAVALAAGHDARGAWKFLLLGLLAPGASQIFFTAAIREVGSSRTSVIAGAGPLVAVTIALLFLDEPPRLPLLAGALLVVAGGLALAGERDRPEHLRRAGLAFAVGGVVLFAVRDNLTRALHAHASPLPAAAASMLAGTLVVLAFARRPPTRLELRLLAPGGVLFGLSYVLMFEAYFHGRVTVVSPLVATESLWGVAASALVFRHAESVGRRLALGAVLVVAGGALIGAFR
jgi:drug/metabolite transporter (DMT)-like permease